MFGTEIEMTTPLDAVDSLDHMTAMLKGLEMLCIAACENPLTVNENTFGLLADIVHQCSHMGEKASELLRSDLGSSSGEAGGLARSAEGGEGALLTNAVRAA
ncbi:hypothetical protein [Xiamenia xianingshaonis]|uniref:Uncharacterized protein n=1 Tax=Xiamenia xianingshaonis TaxID=2682776 RepID=A0A9E6SUU1_9ACTN|nr:hypothetical protein [Xiamenia xianingshaonis]NHM13327.1 hypothetical protein [Xiamenia xianingshaonis]QTU84592.1 hypothetical protein J7S26_01275 [Xiamenia xianingshaonis]